MNLSTWLNDERLLANLIAIHVVLAVIVGSSILLRRLLQNGGEKLLRWTGLPVLDSFGKEAIRGLRAMLFWSTVALMLGSVVSIVAYHLSGRDIRGDGKDWVAQLSGAHLLAFVIMLGKFVALAVAVSVSFRLIRRGRVFIEANVYRHLLGPITAERAAPSAPLKAGEPDARQMLEETIKHWFVLLERYSLALTLLIGLWLAGRVVGLNDADSWTALVLRVLTAIMVARLLTLGCRTMFHLLTNVGNRHLDKGSLHRYWDRIVRLFPFGQRCFEAAVWIFAASQCAEALKFIAVVATFGTGVVQCIGIFFLTRVLIELLHVFINTAFGMYDERQEIDQKGQTLVPLLESVSQYVLYFGSVLMMLHVFRIDTTPILAGAGVVGLAVGLGAQNLVADVVAGFFVLFENQFLVGDIVQIGDAIGKVEAINIRHTQIRDESGKLYIIPNGQIKTVINFSKGYVNAVVDIKVATSANLELVMRDMSEAGRRLRGRRAEVIGETVIKGLVELTPTDMVIRAVTKVRPGTHLPMQLEYRKILKEIFDEGVRPVLKAISA